MSPTPLISIVVVTWNNENFIEQALRSCIFPGFDNYEVLVVHNASTDRTAEVFHRITDEHPDIFRIVENERNEGLGEARNIGLRHSRGQFVLFLDGDDWYDTSLLARIVPLLTSKNPDVVVFNHARAWDTGAIHPNANSNLLLQSNCSDIQGKIRILPNFNTAWNKVYRRDFLLDHKLEFTRRLYEDIDWHFKVLALSESYFAIPDVLIYYRQRHGSILRSESDAHFDILDQYREVFDFLRSNSDFLANYGKPAYEHAQGLLLNVILNTGRIPRKSQRRYLKEMNALLQEWRDVVGVRKKGKALSLASLNSPILLQLAKGARDLQGSLRERLRRTKVGRLAARTIKRMAFSYYQRFPIKEDLVLCESYWGKKIDCNPRALAEGLKKDGTYDIVWSLTTDAVFSPTELVGSRSVIKGSFAYLHALARAKYLINNANFPTEYPQRPDQIFVQTKHGTPLKLMGTDIRKRRPKEMNWGNFAARCRNWDYVISSNPYSSAAWRQGFPFGYSMLETGYPRNDPLFVQDHNKSEEIRAQFSIPAGRKVALYAPTFRDSPSGRRKSDIFDPQKVAEALGDSYTLLMRGHYFDGSGRTFRNVIDVSSYPNTADILRITDLLITDYSSIMFDFACLKRPIVLYQYDWSHYQDTRGTYMDLRDLPPGPIVETHKDLLDVLRTGSFESADNQSSLVAFNKKFCPWDDGHATERVINQVFKG